MSRQDWRTPPSVFQALNDQFGPFDCDAAANELDHLCENWLGQNHHGIGYGWRNWCNPPFGDIEPFVEAAVKINILGRHTVMLTHNNCCSPWFRRASQHAALYLPDGRISFWHPDEEPGHPDRDTVIWHFGGEPGRIFLISLPPHRDEVKRLWAEANGQGTLL